MVTAMATLLLLGCFMILYVAGQKYETENHLCKEECDVVSLMHNAPWRRTPTPARSATSADITTTRRVLEDPRPPRTDDQDARAHEAAGGGGDEWNRHADRSRSRPRMGGDGARAAEARNATETGLTMRPPRLSCSNPELPANGKPASL